MSEITRVGADLAKRVIQVHAVDVGGKLVTNKALARDKFILWCAQLPAGCLVAMEAEPVHKQSLRTICDWRRATR